MKYIVEILWGLASVVLLGSIAVHAFGKEPIDKHSVSCHGRLGDLNMCKQIAKMACPTGYNTVSFNKVVIRAKGPQYKATLTFNCK